MSERTAEVGAREAPDQLGLDPAILLRCRHHLRHHLANSASKPSRIIAIIFSASRTTVIIVLGGFFCPVSFYSLFLDKITGIGRNVVRKAANGWRVSGKKLPTSSVHIITRRRLDTGRSTPLRTGDKNQS
jgi:hypothetical protein